MGVEVLSNSLERMSVDRSLLEGKINLRISAGGASLEASEEFSKNFNGSYPLNGYKQLPDSGMPPIVISPNIFYTTTLDEFDPREVKRLVMDSREKLNPCREISRESGDVYLRKSLLDRFTVSVPLIKDGAMIAGLNYNGICVDLEKNVI